MILTILYICIMFFYIYDLCIIRKTTIINNLSMSIFLKFHIFNWASKFSRKTPFKKEAKEKKSYFVRQAIISFRYNATLSISEFKARLYIVASTIYISVGRGRRPQYRIPIRLFCIRIQPWKTIGSGLDRDWVWAPESGFKSEMCSHLLIIFNYYLPKL